MATATRSSTSFPPALVDELREIVDRHDRNRVQSLVTAFVARHRLTHGDVDDLLMVLTRQRASGYQAVSSSGSVVQPSMSPDLASADVAGSHVAGGEPHEFSTASGAAPGQSPDEATADDGPDWLFGDAPEQPVSSASDGAVGVAFEDLLGDWSRTGGS